MPLRANNLTRDAIGRNARRSAGHRPAPMQLAAGQAMDISVGDRSALPVVVSDTQLQNSSGQALFVMGWSAMGGPDLMG